jgi:hypothetical protein
VNGSIAAGRHDFLVALGHGMTGKRFGFTGLRGRADDGRACDSLDLCPQTFCPFATRRRIENDDGVIHP